MQKPTIDPDALIEHAGHYVPNAVVLYEIVSPEHRSWRLRMSVSGVLDIEFFWGPLTGFGASDFLDVLDPASSSDPFTPFDTYLASLEDAKKYIDKKTNRA